MPKSRKRSNFKPRFFALSDSERARVIDFFKTRFGVSPSFWDRVVLYKKVHSVWLCSSIAWKLSAQLRTESVGLMLLQEFKTLKPTKQAENLFAYQTAVQP